MPEKAKELQSKWDEWNAANIKPRWGSAHTDDDGAEPGARPPKKAKKSQGCCCEGGMTGERRAPKTFFNLR
jgi:hypothetical protein